MSAPNKAGEGGERKKKESILELSRWHFTVYNLYLDNLTYTLHLILNIFMPDT